jgi:probable F420-dependent oxidoreductase
MRLGTTLPHMGEGARPEVVVAAAQRAEALGYDTVWVADRLLYPLQPRTPYPSTPDGSLPEFYKVVLDPLATLTYVAARTERLRLGTSVLNMPFYNPALLGRQLTSLDVLSGGRLRVGLGQGWSADEFEAVGASAKERAGRADEFIAALEAWWGPDPVAFEGKYYRIPPSIIGLKPVQRPRPPLYLAAYTPAAMQRAARLADGWLPMGIPVPALEGLVPQFRDLVRAAGRDPAAVAVIVGGFPVVTPTPQGADRGIFIGTPDQIRDDVQRLAALGVEELLLALMPPAGEGLDGLVRAMEQMRELAA